MKSKLNDLIDERSYYLDKVKEVISERKELFSSNEQLEKFARETYLMKRKTEDVYVIVKQ